MHQRMKNFVKVEELCSRCDECMSSAVFSSLSTTNPPQSKATTASQQVLSQKLQPCMPYNMQNIQAYGLHQSWPKVSRHPLMQLQPTHLAPTEYVFSGQRGSETGFHHLRCMLIYIKPNQVASAMQLQLPRIIIALKSFKNELVPELFVEDVHSPTGATAIRTQTWLLFA